MPLKPNKNGKNDFPDLDVDAWNAGFSAGEKRQSKCPYPAASPMAFSWHAGFVEGDAKRQGFSYTRVLTDAQEITKMVAWMTRP